MKIPMKFNPENRTQRDLDKFLQQNKFWCAFMLANSPTNPVQIVDRLRDLDTSGYDVSVVVLKNHTFDPLNPKGKYESHEIKLGLYLGDASLPHGLDPIRTHENGDIPGTFKIVSAAGYLEYDDERKNSLFHIPKINKNGFFKSSTSYLEDAIERDVKFTRAKDFVNYRCEIDGLTAKYTQVLSVYTTWQSHV